MPDPAVPLSPRSHLRGRPRKVSPEKTLALSFRPVVHAFVSAVAAGAAREYAVFGTRGDGKTQGVLGAMLNHARVHAEKGFPLPVTWMWVTDTFASHKIKTKESLLKPLWTAAGRAVWHLSDGDHVATAMVNGHAVVRGLLFGIEDQGAQDRVRMECTGVWFEEPAPVAVLVQSGGMDEISWSVALTSQRVPSHCYPAIMSLNYPDEDHWTWKRFRPTSGPLRKDSPLAECRGFHPDDPSRMWFRIPPGERATPGERAEWAHALRERPDLLRRLLDGQPGVVLLGPQVAEGFREDLHVARTRLRPQEGEPLFLGQDFGHTPATVIGQAWRGQLRVLAALPCERGGIRQHAESAVLPWLSQHAPWTLQQARVLLRGCHDPAGETAEESDIERNPQDALEKAVGGLWWPGPVKWEARKHCLLSALHRHMAPGEPALQIDPVDGLPLVKALSGRWHYSVDRLGAVRRDLPKKPNHPWEDLGDAFIYLLWAMMGETQPPTDAEPKVETAFELRMPQLGRRF